MSGWFDSHCHLDLIEGGADAAVERARSAGIGGLITVGIDLSSSREATAIASRNAEVFAAVGIHPHEAASLGADTLENLRRLASAPGVVGIGETGLDYYRDRSPRADQQRSFRLQINLAKELSLALIVHVRDSHEDVFRILASEGPPDLLVFHCFSGGPEEARRALELGGYLSFAGNLTYPSAGRLREAASAAPLDRLLVETDSPFLAPQLRRGRPNEPAYAVLVGEGVASACGVAADRLAEATTENARRVFSLTASR